MIVTNEKTLKEFYEFLQVCKNNEALKNNSANRDFIVQIKTAIREYYKRLDKRESESGALIIATDDSYIEVVNVPDYVDDDDISAWFEECIYKKHYFSEYDCNGYPFTSWYKIAKRQGRRVVYHCVCFDI